MSRSRRPRILALLLLAVPLVASEGAPPSPGTALVASSCLEGYVNVTAGSTTVGPTSSVCLLPTDCDFRVGSGPKTYNVGDASLAYYASAPQPESPSDLACYA